MVNSLVDKSPDFDFEPISPAEQRERQRKLLQVALLVGGMIVVILLLVVGMICYSLGYNAANQESSSSTVDLTDTGDDGSQDTATAPEEASKFQSQDIVGEGQIPDHYRGSDGAQVVAIEYADFPCSHCISLAGELDDLYNKYGDKVQFIYRHYNVGFTYSDVTAKISEAAYLVGGEDAYWRMSDKLFNDSTWSQGDYMDDSALNEKIISYGNDLGLDGQALLDTYNNSASNGIEAKIQRDRSLGEQSGVTGTPTWFVNGESVRGKVDAISEKLDELTK